MMCEVNHEVFHLVMISPRPEGAVSWYLHKIRNITQYIYIKILLKFNVFKLHDINSLMDTAQDNNSLDSLDLTDLKDSVLCNTAVERQLQFHLLVKIEAYDIRYLRAKQT